MKNKVDEALALYTTAQESVVKAKHFQSVDILTDTSRYDAYVERCRDFEKYYVKTGFSELDKLIGGWDRLEELATISARPGVGKSWVLLKCAVAALEQGLTVGMYSGEMSTNKVGYRFDTLNEHFSNFALYTGRNIERDYKQYIEDLENNSKNTFIVATPLDFNKKITVSKLRKFCIKNKLDMLGIDGITYLTDERYKRGDNKTTSLTNISEDLMSLSCELKIPILAVVQANRSGVEEDGSAPSLESIRDSDGIAHNASKVLSIRQRNDRLNIEVTKARNCKVGTKVSYDWKIDTGEFEYNASPDEYVETEEHPRRYENNRQQQPTENKQPLVARRGSTENPF
jgi:replicative DNA helicase